jgi:hypothetical protein
MAYPHRRLVAAGFALAALLATPAFAIAATSHTSVWETKTVICGIEAPALSKTEVLCQAKGVPRPPHTTTNVGDPGVVLAAHGKPALILMSQDQYPANSTIRTLVTGTHWSGRGVTCTIARRTVTCTNRSKHGFTIGNDRYKHF